MSAIIEVPEAVRRKARAVGSAGDRWLDELGSIVAGLDTLLLGRGRGYVAVLRSDRGRRAMLQARLGRPLGQLGRPVEAQIDVIAATLSRGWRRLPDGAPLRTGAEQARFLEASIRDGWRALGRPCPRATIEVACEYARSRRDAFDASTAVLIHGDAHPANVLEDLADGSPRTFKLVDPDGMRSEPAHDLAIPLRDWSDELLASDPVALGRAWCVRLADRTGTDPQAIWEWAFVERVSTGLFLIQLGDQLGARLLEVAAAWTGEQPERDQHAVVAAQAAPAESFTCCVLVPPARTATRWLRNSARPKCLTSHDRAVRFR